MQERLQSTGPIVLREGYINVPPCGCPRRHRQGALAARIGARGCRSRVDPASTTRFAALGGGAASHIDTAPASLAAVPKPMPRRAMLDPRRARATGCLIAGNNTRGSGTARRPRSWIRRCAQALAASSDARPTKGPRHWMPDRRKQHPWVGLRPTPARLDSPLCPSRRRVERCSTHERASTLDASAPATSPVGRALPDARAPGFAAVPKPSPRRAMLDPRKGLDTGCLIAGNNPRGSGFARRPRARIRPCAQALAASSDARPTKGPRHWIPDRWKQPPWVGLRPTPARPDSPLCPSPRRVERCSTHERASTLDA
jgi:hypothetical protein